MMKKIFAALLACLPLASYGFASSGASFLKLGVGARALGLGSAYTAVANDATALHWNPAGLAKLDKNELSATHAELFADTSFDSLDYAHSTSKGAFGIGAVDLNQGEIEGRGETRETAGNFSASDMAVTLGWGGRFRQRSGIGASAKVIQSKIAGYTSTGLAFDAGFQSRLSPPTGSPVLVGFSVQNLGPKMTFIDQSFNLPLTLAAGAGYPVLKNLLLSADMKYQPHDSRTSFSAGAEFSPISALSLRAGYLTNAIRQTGPVNSNITEKVSNLSGLGLGMGLKLGSASVDYSFTPAGELGNTQRVSLSIKF